MGRNGYSTGVMLGVVAGLFVGLAAGFLYAPRSGKETGELIRERVRDAGDKAAELVYQAKDCVAMRLKGIPDYSSSGDL
jgi:gas vesicle protein